MEFRLPKVRPSKFRPPDEDKAKEVLFEVFLLGVGLFCLSPIIGLTCTQIGLGAMLAGLLWCLMGLMGWNGGKCDGGNGTTGTTGTDGTGTELGRDGVQPVADDRGESRGADTGVVEPAPSHEKAVERKPGKGKSSKGDK